MIFQTFEPSHQISWNSKFKFLDYLPCTCKIPGQDHFLAFNFQNFCGTFYDFLNAKGLQYLISIWMFWNKAIFKKVVSKGWCKESKHEIYANHNCQSSRTQGSFQANITKAGHLSC